MEQHKIKIKNNMSVGELYREMVKAVDAYGTEATLDLTVGTFDVTITPRSRDERV